MRYYIPHLITWLPHSPSRHISRSKIDSVGMLILFRGAQICHDVHCLHDVIHHMSVPHKLFCGLPVDDLCLWDTTISATNTRWFLIKKIQKLQATPVNALFAFCKIKLTLYHLHLLLVLSSLSKAGHPLSQECGPCFACVQ